MSKSRVSFDRLRAPRAKPRALTESFIHDLTRSRPGNSKLAKSVFVCASLFFVAPAVYACTLCHSPDAMELRHMIFEHGFVNNLVSLALPIPLLLGVIFLAGIERPGAGSANPVQNREHA